MASTELRAAAQQVLEACEQRLPLKGQAEIIDELNSLRAALAKPVQEHDLSRCPKCNGPADNGHDREVPPNPYYCTKCMAEPVAWRWGYRSVTTGEMDWRGYVEIAAHPNLRSPEIIMEPLYAAPPQRPAEPVACEWPSCGCRVDLGEDWKACRPDAPPLQHKPLTEDEISEIASRLEQQGNTMRQFARAIEAAHGIGGEG